MICVYVACFEFGCGLFLLACLLVFDFACLGWWFYFAFSWIADLLIWVSSLLVCGYGDFVLGLFIWCVLCYFIFCGVLCFFECLCCYCIIWLLLACLYTDDACLSDLL